MRDDFSWSGWLILCLLSTAPLLAQPAPPAETPAAPGLASFERDVLPAAGRQTALLSIPELGRYAVTVQSASGTALQVVDRMAGAGEIAGSAGERDGRVDLFLDRGEVRVVTYGNRLATGEARLAANRFTDRSPATPERLVEGRLVTVELGDLEERCWWIELTQRRRVTFEAAGRHLADLRLWQNGSWLVDTAPEVSEIEPVPGRPLALLRLGADLGPGTYRLAAYGGAGRAWARGGGERPLYLRSGIPRDSAALRERRTVSPFGFDRVLVSAAVDHFRLELDEPPAAEGAELEVRDYDPEAPFAEDGTSSTISRESVPPVATVDLGGQEGDRVVVVRAAAGTPYVLQHFTREGSRRLGRPGRYWISTVSSGAAGDAIDGTAIAVELGASAGGRKRAPRVVAADVPELSPSGGWAGRFNLASRATLQFEVKVAGEYEIRSSGVAVQARVEPFFISPPEDYQAPPPRTPPSSWTLDPGYYVLELVPVESGIAGIELVPKGAPQLPPTPRGSAQLGVVEVAVNRELLVQTNDRPDTPNGIVARELPLDLVAALPVSLGPGEEMELPFRAPAPSRLAARDEFGAALLVSVDGAPFAEAAEVAAGAHTARVRAAAEKRAIASLGLVLNERAADAPLPPLSPAALSAIAGVARAPLFPDLEAGASARPLDLERSQAATFRLAAAEPALYRIETTGLLATEAALRTRIQPSLIAAAENGSGRNARLSAYLSTGDYQLTVRPRGASAGHLGVALARSAVADGGKLLVEEGTVAGGPPRAPARARLAPGEALSYRFDVAEAGMYRVSARGLARDFRLRLEDAEGWPVSAPFADGASIELLPPGSYRLLVLPQPVEARVAVAVEKLRSEEAVSALEGEARSAPLLLPLDREVERVWREPAADLPQGTRADDRYRFTLPAPTAVTVSLSPEMTGELLRSGSPDPLATLRPGRGFRGALERGDYELRLRAVRRDEGRRYRLSVRPDDLVDGLRRAITAPADLRLSVGVESDIELASFGGVDLRARLYDAAGRELAAADDRPADWNFLLQRRLAPGRYRLHVDRAGAGGSGSSEIEMRVPRERVEAALAAGEGGGSRDVQVGEEVVLVPLALPAGAEVVAAGASAAESLGLAIEERQGDRWRAVASTEGRAASVLVPLAAEPSEIRLRIVSLDRRPVGVKLSAFAGALAHRSESDLARGIELPRLPGVEPAVAAAVVDLAAPGCFRRTDDAELLQSLAMGAPFAGAAPTLAAVGLKIPLAAIGDAAKDLRVRAERARVGDGAPLPVVLPPAVPILCDVADGGPVEVELVATSGEPVVGFVSETGEWGRSTELGRAGSGRAFAGAAAGKGRAVELWNAGTMPVEARLEGRLASELAPAAASKVGSALATWPIPPGRVVPLALAPGAKSVEIGVAGGGGALLMRGGEAVAYLRDEGDAKLERIATDADRLLLFGPRATRVAGEAESGAIEPALVAVAVLPGGASPEAPPPTAERPFERRVATAGRIRMRFPPGSGPATLAVSGAVSAVLLGADGSVARGESLVVPAAGGELRLEVPPGFVTVWRAEGESGPAIARGAKAQPLALPAVIALAGAEQAFGIALREPALLSLRSANALAFSAERGGKVVAAGAFAAGAAFDLVAPAGEIRLGLRGLAGETLAGSALITASELAPLREGLGEEQLLAPGESRAFRFELVSRATVGAGVRSDRAGVDARLYDAAGAELGRGAAIWRELEAGAYALVVAAPPDAPPARVRAALVGTAAPGDGPPREEIERFLALAGAAPPDAGKRGVAGEEDRYEAPWREGPPERDDGGDETEEDDEPHGEYDEEGGEG